MTSGTYLGHIEVKGQRQPAEISTSFCLDKQTLNSSTPFISAFIIISTQMEHNVTLKC